MSDERTTTKRERPEPPMGGPIATMGIDRRKNLRSRMWETRTGYIMVVPTLLFLLIFQYYPAIFGLYRSMFNWNPGLAARFVGLGNFVELFTKDRKFVGSMRNMATSRS